MATLSNGGIEVHHEVHGTGRPVVLLHGGTVNFEFNYAAHGWIERLNGCGLQVIGLDFRGHGKSAKPHDSASYGTAQLVSDVMAVLNHLALDSVMVVGYSIGAAVALQLLHDAPARFSKAALVATGDGLIGLPPFTLARILPALAAVLERTEYPDDLPRSVAAYWNFVEQTAGDRMALRAMAMARHPPLSAEQAGAIRTPTLVVSGQNDRVMGRGARLAAGLGQGTYLEIAGADHFSLASDLSVQTAVTEFLLSGGTGNGE